MKGLDKLELRIYTYKELCKLFGQQEKKANSKKAQLKEWACYFLWTNLTTHKFLITEIFDEPHEKEDGRNTNGGHITSKFIALDDLIMVHLKNKGEFSGTSTDLLIEIGILSSKYKDIQYKQYGFVEKGFPSYVVSYYNIAVINCVYKSLHSSFARLVKNNYITVQSYFILKLFNGSDIVADTAMTERIIEIEKEVLQELGLTRQEIILNNNNEYKKKVKSVIKKEFGYDVNYYYKNYDLKIMTEDYTNQSSETIELLTRKYVITIALSMLKLDIQGDEYDSTKEYTMDELIFDTIELINISFVYMNSSSWERYWDEIERLDSYQKGALFWTQFLLTKYHDDLQDKRKEQDVEIKEKMEKEKYRNIALEELDEESILEFEQIIPNLDWALVFSETSEKRDEYIDRCDRALTIYYKVRDKNAWNQNKEIVNKYQLYLAHGIMEGKTEEELMEYGEFVKQYDPNKEY